EVTDVGFGDINGRDKTESSTIINRQMIEVLPINRRDFLDFAITAPRVTLSRTPTTGVGSSSGLSLNGQSPRANNITIDGLDNNDFGTGSVRSTFNQESVREFQVLSDSFSAEFGRALGGIINIVTQGGTNEYHGSLFFLERDERLSARRALNSI